MILEKIFFPGNIYCVCCGAVIDATRPYSLCDKCMERFRWADGRTCAKCGKPLGDAWKHDICADCREREHVFDKGFTCLQYGLYEKRLIAEYKYLRKKYIARVISEIMYDRMECEDISYDIVTAVPVHRSRLKTRGFDQAALCASMFAERAGTEYADSLVRVKHTRAMKSLNAEERKINISGAFAAAAGAADRIKGKDVLLVDDIYTTGSTADVCAAVLKNEGARAVYVLTLASGGNMIKPSGG
ncbi:MAG: ComF family protein [Anaerovoracaceae bacterium]|nr:ComF family protein [Anaerovoracaceae bacterium]